MFHAPFKINELKSKLFDYMAVFVHSPAIQQWFTTKQFVLAWIPHNSLLMSECIWNSYECDQIFFSSQPTCIDTKGNFCEIWNRLKSTVKLSHLSKSVRKSVQPYRNTDWPVSIWWSFMSHREIRSFCFSDSGHNRIINVINHSRKLNCTN